MLAELDQAVEEEVMDTEMNKRLNWIAWTPLLGCIITVLVWEFGVKNVNSNNSVHLYSVILLNCM